MTKNNIGEFVYKKAETAVEFYCERCQKKKKSKITVKWTDIENITKLICNGCYGLLLSKADSTKK
jgi:transcription elongation factor Elf1